MKTLNQVVLLPFFSSLSSNFSLPPSPQKRLHASPKKKMEKREGLIAGVHYAIAVIKCLPGCVHFNLL